MSITTNTIIQVSNLFSLFFVFVHLLLYSSSNAQAFDTESQDVKRYQFPDNFLFGTATSSYQVEGGYLDDGKGLSNWDVFTHIPGKINNDENGDVADDDYHLFLEDIELAHSLGVNAYRFSISWARILPKGKFGEVNPNGIEFYNKIIDKLLLMGLEPFVTIFHFDYPQELDERYGSWLNPLIQEDFVLFAKTCFKSFGDRVKYWITINEPNVYADMAYIRGIYPPAHCSPPFGNCSVGNSDVEPLIVMHNLLLSHAKAAKLYRQEFQPEQGGNIGIVVNNHWYEPLRDEEVDHQAVKRALAFIGGGWALDPLVFGDYPPEMRQYHENALPRFSPEEAEYVKGSIDFIGLNHYSTLYAKDCIHSSCQSGGDHFIKGFAYTTGERDGIPIGEPTGVDRFYVVPRGMEKVIDYISKRYNNMPIYVTENGYSPPMPQTEQAPDLLHDVDRIKFHKTYLAALARAIRKGANVRGYFVWTLIDNFEWTGGYGTTFGLHYVDRQTLKRTPKLSATWYHDFLGNRSRASNSQKLKNCKKGSKHFPRSNYIRISKTEPAKAKEI
ncbi:Glycoside hydrolase, family 1 [Corchorus olitorius]|uniref:Glycoside hydrolase, family 1 n=1 Tax=Corchorus olitorius TaxID=93759 RepID=A0A1R3KC77_9ROSI|nr:Glycoside hydrolase, family 1 [Corchorus olitorius]